MAITKVVLAKLSPTMEEGTIVRWAKNEGDAVKVGDILAEIETDKANMEMESQGAGILRKILVQAGGKAPVGSLIGVIANADEDIAPMIAKAAGAAKPAAAAAPPAAAPPKAPAPAAASQAAPAAPAPSPAAAGPAAAAKAAPADQSASAAEAQRTPAVHGSAPAPAAAAAPRPAPASGEGGRVKSSPLARSMAARDNVSLEGIAGTGPGGRIVKRDIEAAAAAPRAQARPAAPTPAAPGPVPGQDIPVSNMRRVIAKRLSESAFTAPHFYVTVEIDMDACAELREQVAAAGEKISYNDLVVKACANALPKFPMVNASWMGDKITTHAEVHIGVAVAIPDGLITPVVRNADRKRVSEIGSEVKDLARRAKDRKLKPEEFMGSTFTISNLGMYDVSEFTAIINPPEAAILAVGGVRRVPVVIDDGVTVGHRMKVTLSSDHRVVDGATAAQFLAEVRRLLEFPLLLLL